MGFFGRVFGKRKQRDSPPPRQPINVGLVEDRGPPPVDETTFVGGPFPRKVRVRPVLSDYGLRGRWKVVLLEDASSWGMAREELVKAYYERFGLMRMRDGSKTIRWNEFTWRGIRENLQFEQDAAYRGDVTAASPSG